MAAEHHKVICLETSELPACSVSEHERNSREGMSVIQQQKHGVKRLWSASVVYVSLFPKVSVSSQLLVFGLRAMAKKRSASLVSK